MIPTTLLDPPHRTEIGTAAVSTCRLRPRSWLIPPDTRPRWETAVLNLPEFDAESEDTYTEADALALHERRVAEVRAFLGLARTDGPSDGDLEAALADLECYADLTPRARDTLVGIDAADCTSPRARDLFAALNDWDSAGTGGNRISTRDHERVWMRIGAALLDQILADRQADPALVAELSASVAPTDMASLGVSRGDWKPTPGDRIRELVKAGALIAAEIDRLIRAETANERAHDRQMERDLQGETGPTQIAKAIREGGR